MNNFSSQIQHNNKGQKIDNRLIRNLFISFFLLLFFMIWESSLSFSEEIIIGIFIVLASFLPSLLWLSSRDRELPAFQIFTFTHFLYYGIPILSGNSTYTIFSNETRLKSAYTVLAFLLISNVIYYFNKKKNKRIPFLDSFLSKELPETLAIRLFNFGLLIWFFSVLIRQLGLIHLTGLFVNTFWTFGSVAGSLSFFILFKKAGNKKLNILNRNFVFIILFLGCLVSFSSGLLVHGTAFILISIAGYVVGSKKVPLITIIACFILIAFLHAGKSEVRQKYWHNYSTYSSTGINRIIDIIEYWIPTSWNALTITPQEKLGPKSLFNRLSLIHMQALVVELSPRRIPFLYGETYSHIPMLIIPRFLWPGKPHGHISTEVLGLTYGVQTHESVKHTSIGFGLLAEAWANFGWIGIIILALFFGYSMRLISQLCYYSNELSMMSLIGSVWLGFSFQIEAAMSSWIISFCQSLLIMILSLHLFSTSKKKITQ